MPSQVMHYGQRPLWYIDTQIYRQKLSNADISVLLADTAHWVHSLICTNCEQYVFISTINIDGVKNLYKLKTVILWTLVPIIGGIQNDFHHYPPLSHDQFPLEIDFSKKIISDRKPSTLSNIWLFQPRVNILHCSCIPWDGPSTLVWWPDFSTFPLKPQTNWIFALSFSGLSCLALIWAEW